MTTIFALSTPWGRSGVAVIRLSGPEALASLEAMTMRPAPEPRRAVKRRLWAQMDGAAPIPLDDAMVLWLPGPGSYTGEDMVELSVHGGPAVIAAMLVALGARAWHRMAEPGEFSRRAFYNNKLDLLEIEGVADLIAAETEAQRLQALRQAEGETSALNEKWRALLVRLMAAHEAAIDFPDEEIPSTIVDRATREMAALVREIERFLDDSRAGERLRDGLMVAILGAPNAGKSSLLNRLAGREAAIVAVTEGTTRDVIEVRLDLEGLPVTLSDTAGLRASLDAIENEGMRRALARAQSSDLRILVFDGGLWPGIDAQTSSLIDEAAILVLNKVDLGRVPPDVRIGGRAGIPLSALTGEGISNLTGEIAARARNMMARGEGPVVTRARHREELKLVAGALRRGLELTSVELRAEELRVAAGALGRLAGRIEIEDLLDGIFGEFCIGK